MITKQLIRELRKLDPEETSDIIINDLDEELNKDIIRFEYDGEDKIFIACSRLWSVE